MGFKMDESVSFGDVNLSHAGIRKSNPHHPGHLDLDEKQKKAWPKILFYNKETGIGGGKYERKTKEKMCEELGDFDYMVDYVSEKAKTSLCKVSSAAFCDKEDLEYIGVWKKKWRRQCVNELKRVDGDLLVLQEPNNTKLDEVRLLRKQRNILRQLITLGDEL